MSLCCTASLLTPKFHGLFDAAAEAVGLRKLLKLFGISAVGLLFGWYMLLKPFEYAPLPTDVGSYAAEAL